ncbi:cytochrome c oxidase subunit II [Fictibacillus iocasae]|uniref:Cytochrome aa3 subunit 2 n=1 Tax=Fictibacillus iocasae TaxID=2715437 RepID=A0ABW2NNX2_9BACL
MHIHKYEKLWLWFGAVCLVAFLSIVGVSAYAMGSHPPSHMETLDPKTATATAPFDKPGLFKKGNKEYEAVMLAQAFTFTPQKLQVPAGSTVTFKVTSTDVVHGFQIPATNVNMMITPGYVSTIKQTFTKPGKYLILCNEYCGAGHQVMAVTLEVTP